MDSGVVQKQTPMDGSYFGEGLTRMGDKLYQITWLTNEGFIYSIPDLQQVRGRLRTGWRVVKRCA